MYNSKTADYDLLLKNINVIDGTGNPMKENVNVFIKKERIIEITQEPFEEPDSSKTINGSEKYLIPGIIDAHIHLSTPSNIEYGKDRFSNTLQQLIHYGVTTVLIPGGHQDTYQNLQGDDIN